MKRAILLLVSLPFVAPPFSRWQWREWLYEEDHQTSSRQLYCRTTRNILPADIFYSPPTTCACLDEADYHSRGLDPAWGPVPYYNDGGNCGTSPEPISDSLWIDLNKRVRFLWDQSCAEAKILCFPNVESLRSRGGPIIFALCAGRPEMEFLGLAEVTEDVLRNMRDREEEDRLCERMRLLGAQENDGYYDMVGNGLSCTRYGYKHRRRGVTLFGWPKAGGVWVLRLDNRQLKAVGGMEALRDETNVDMETQSRLIEELGGRFYADPVECRELDFLRGPRFALAGL